MSDCASAPAKWDLSSGPGVSFAGTPDDHDKPLMQMQSRPSREVVRREMDNCDAVIVRQSNLGWLAAREAQYRGIPWAVEVVGDAWNAYWHYGGIVGKLYAPYAFMQSRRWIGRACFAIYVTSKYLQERYPCTGVRGSASDVEIRPVPNSVMEGRLVRCHKGGLYSAQSPMIGMVGSLFNRHKGLYVALKAMRRLLDHGTPAKLNVLGDGRLDYWRSQAQRLGVGDVVSFQGGLPSGEPVMKWLDRMDIYIQPSLTEGLPRALIEAMSRGLPCLGSACGGIPELLLPECLHRPGDDKVLAHQLMRAVEDKAWRIQQSHTNWEKAQVYHRDQVEVQRDAFWSLFVDGIRKGRCCS